MRFSIKKWLPIGFSVVFAAVLTLQYPVLATFPIGGDAARSIDRAQQVLSSTLEAPAHGLNALISNSNYPGSTFTIAATKALPLSWPDRWIWLTTAAHLATALTVGYVLYRINGPNTAAIGIAVWAIIGISFTRHIEDGTLAQLLSLPLLVIALEKFWSNRWAVGSTLLVITYMFHPVTAGIGAITTIWSFLLNPPKQVKKKRNQIIIAASLIIAICIVVFIVKETYGVITTYPSSDEGISIHDLLSNPIGVFVLLAPLGWISLKEKKHSAATWLIAFLTLSTVLIFHFRLVGSSVFLDRFISYFALAVSLLGAIALASVIEKLKSKPVVVSIVSLLLIGLGLQTWQQEIPMYVQYESPSRYERIHETEITAMKWAKENIGSDSVIVSTTTNRFTDWTPILTERKWVGLAADDSLFRKTGEELKEVLESQPYTHAMFLTKREKPEETMASFYSFTPIYDTEEVVILDLKSYAP